MKFSFDQITELVEMSLEEDSFSKDITSRLLVDKNFIANVSIISKSEGILSGIDLLEFVFHKVDPNIVLIKKYSDGDKINKSDIIATLNGSLISILSAERTALNFIQRMTGISTITSEYVKLISNYNTKIFDTRKTVPGHRILDKYAVFIGGGVNHRKNLSDGILIKDTHIDHLKSKGYSVEKIIDKIKLSNRSNLKIEIEVESLEDAISAAKSQVDIIMLDNMEINLLKETVKKVRDISNTILIEVSGGVNKQNVRSISETGVDIISIGSLTHSVISHDFSLKFSK
ncbi:MAG: nicotinate-nucleotide diphosphorylase (carboxylating) [Chloroflexi bacterium]|nr:nicotinate-nucleotide diphosphorylase (carboxylating) [Chloroflexota bacterium]|tara:strand:- start:455 stop:1315 length:861 start_codon:yes stop_codon:yes gene_type:complete